MFNLFKFNVYTIYLLYSILKCIQCSMDLVSFVLIPNFLHASIFQ